MPRMFSNPMEQSNRVMQNIIPLYMRMKQTKKALELEQQKIDYQKAVLEEEKAEKKRELEAEAQKTAIKNAKDKRKEAEDKRRFEITHASKGLEYGLSHGLKDMVQQHGQTLLGLGQDVGTIPRPQGPERGGTFPTQFEMPPLKSKLTGTAKNLEILLGRRPTLKELKDFKASGKGPVETPQERRAIENRRREEDRKKTEKRRLEDDIVQSQLKKASLQSGQDITSEALGSERIVAIKNLEQRIDQMSARYKELGGNLGRIGREVKEKIKAIEKDQVADVKIDDVIVNNKTGERKRWNGSRWVTIK